MCGPIVNVALSLTLGFRLTRVGWNSVDELPGGIGDQIVLASDLLFNVLCVSFSPCCSHGLICCILDRISTIFLLSDQVINTSESVIDAIVGRLKELLHFAIIFDARDKGNIKEGLYIGSDIIALFRFHVITCQIWVP